jgi:hypothetical protein
VTAKAKTAADKDALVATDAAGTRFGPCGDCAFFIAGEGLGSSVGKGRCHGLPPISGMWPGVPAVGAGCSIFRARV